MPPEVLHRNEAATARIRDLIDHAGETGLARSVHGAWTVSSVLVHLAYWERLAEAVLGRWSRREESRIDVPSWYDDLVNDSVLSLSTEIASPAAVRLALGALKSMDSALAALDSTEFRRLSDDAANPATDTAWLLHRYRHREEHLRELEPS